MTQSPLQEKLVTGYTKQTIQGLPPLKEATGYPQFFPRIYIYHGKSGCCIGYLIVVVRLFLFCGNRLVFHKQNKSPAPCQE